jgi:hypothetical protein
MKTRKFLFTAAIAVLALAHAAFAQTAIYISGAPATRKIWNIALYNTLVTLTGTSTPITKYFTGTSYNSANQILLTGGTIGGNAVTIYGSWTGSTGGNQSVAADPPASNSALEVGFIDPTTLGSAVAGSLATTDTNNFQYPQLNLSDTFQGTTPFHGSVTITSPHTTYDTLTEATPTNPAITGFKFVANAGAPAGISNITTNLAQYFYTHTYTPLAFFTGNTSDRTTKVYPVGRDISSGARYILLAETGIGTANSSSLVQYEPALSGTELTNISGNPAPGGTINLISFSTGNGGYPSFSKVESALASNSTNSIGWIVTYVTDSDAVTAEAAGAHELSWNGVFYGSSFEGANNTAPVSIAEGDYTYWSYLHVYYDAANTTPSSLAGTLATSLSSDLSTDLTTGAILTSDVGVSRLIDGGVIGHTY